MTVTVQKNGKYWQARWYDSNGRQRGKSLGRCTKREANAKARELESRLNNGASPQGHTPTLAAYCERFLANRPDLSEGTAALYRQTIRSLCDHFGPNCRLDRITRADAADWRASLSRAGMAAATISRKTREAKCLFKAATDEDAIPYSPFERLKATTPPSDKQWKYVDQETLGRLLFACPSDHWQRLLALCRLAGLRQGEALRLQWADVDLKRRQLLIRNPEGHQTTKKRSRKVPICPELYRLLAGFRAIGPVVDLHGNLWREFRAICRRAGLEPWAKWCHTLRKNCETDWSRELPLHVVTEWLGNSPAVAIKHYLRAEPQDYDRITLLTNVS